MKRHAMFSMNSDTVTGIPDHKLDPMFIIISKVSLSLDSREK